MGYLGKQPTAVPLSGSDIVDDSIESADIKAGTIVNSDINASAAIAQSKLVDIVNADVDASAAIAQSKSRYCQRRRRCKCSYSHFKTIWCSYKYWLSRSCCLGDY